MNPGDLQKATKFLMGARTLMDDANRDDVEVLLTEAIDILQDNIESGGDVE